LQKSINQPQQQAVFQQIISQKLQKFITPATALKEVQELHQQVSQLASAVETICSAFRTLKIPAEDRKLHSELKKKEVPEDALKGIEQYRNQAMEASIDTIIPDILDTYSKAKDERRNELGNGLRISLNKMANHIDRGYNFEIRVEPIKGAKKEHDPNAEHIDTISQTTKMLEFMKVEGPSVLSLPEAKSEKKKSRRVRKQ
jgi:hypothetical protein